jgi:hypothetical protein
LSWRAASSVLDVKTNEEVANVKHYDDWLTREIPDDEEVEQDDRDFSDWHFDRMDREAELMMR